MDTSLVMNRRRDGEKDIRVDELDSDGDAEEEGGCTLVCCLVTFCNLGCCLLQIFCKTEDLQSWRKVLSR